MKMILAFAMSLCIVVSALGPVTAAEQVPEVKLPKPSLTGKMSVEAAMVTKRSFREFKGVKLTAAQVSQLLWATNGNLGADAVTGATTKVIPSAGGAYPLDAYLVAGKETVEGVPEGVYRYVPERNSLQAVSAGDVRGQLAHAALSQMWMARAPASIVITGVMTRTTSRYGNRGLQYVFMEAGNANQNLLLQAESLGLHTATVGAFQDTQVSTVLSLPSSSTPLLICPVGK